MRRGALVVLREASLRKTIAFAAAILALTGAAFAEDTIGTDSTAPAIAYRSHFLKALRPKWQIPNIVSS